MNLKNELKTLVDSNVTLVHVVSREERRVIEVLKAVAQELKRGLVAWDVADLGDELVPCRPRFDITQPGAMQMLEAIQAFGGDAMFALKDFHAQLKTDGPIVSRKLRNLARALESQKQRKTVFILSPVAALPEELKDELYVVDVPLPTISELQEVFTTRTGGVRHLISLKKTGQDRLVESALGLTTNQFTRVLARILVVKGAIDESAIDLLLTEKQQIIRESGALEFYPASEGLASIGGLKGLKSWLERREIGFAPDGREYGLPFPKGVALIGIPGTGKSLSAKVIARILKMPLLRLDMGAVFGSLVGQSEENIKTAIKLAETVSPCVLWIDEVEKGFAGAGGGGGDAGTAARVFGHFLSWMQDKTKPVYIVATANDVSQVPREFLRKGRFDEVFFLDLPNPQERRDILGVHLRKYLQTSRGFDLDELVGKTENYVGAEIEHAIKEAMYMAANQGLRAVSQDDILQAISEIKPLFGYHKPQTQNLRQWADEVGARHASQLQPEPEPRDDAISMFRRGRKLDIREEDRP